MSKTYLTRFQLVENYPVPKSRPGLRNWVNHKGFPAPVYATPNTPIWTDETVSEWFATRWRNHREALLAAKAA